MKTNVVVSFHPFLTQKLEVAEKTRIDHSEEEGKI